MSLLQVCDLAIEIPQNGQWKNLCREISFEVHHGEFFALAGESGSGKSISAMACLGLYPEPQGRLSHGKILFDGRDMAKLTEKEILKLRGNSISAIFQEPSAALNPLYSVGTQLREAWKQHNSDSTAGVKRIAELLTKVGLHDHRRILNSLPFQLSGGMLQRSCIAMALLHGPRLLIADEPTTALDVTIQAQIMDLLDQLRGEMNMAVLFITHNLALISQRAQRLAILKDGHMVETANCRDFFAQAQDPYSIELLAASQRWGTL